MSLDEFLRAYKLPLLACLLKDNDIGLRLTMNNYGFRVSKFPLSDAVTVKDIVPQPIETQQIEKEYFECIENGKYYSLSRNYLYTEEQIDLVLELLKDRLIQLGNHRKRKNIIRVKYS